MKEQAAQKLQVEIRRRRKLQPKGSAWSKTKLSFPAPPARLPPRAGASGEASPKRGAGPPPLPGMRRGGAGDSFSKRFGIGLGLAGLA